MVSVVSRTREEEKSSTNSGISINVTKLVDNKKEEDLYNPKADVEDNDSTSKRGRPRKTEPVNMTKKNYTHWYELNNNRWIASTKEAINIQRSDTGRVSEIHFSNDAEVLW